MSTKLKRLIQGQVDFNSAFREKIIIVSLVDQNDIEDIQFSFYIQPSFLPIVSTQAFTSAEDIRFYINKDDYTNELKEELKDLIKKQPPNKVKSEYKSGMDSWIRYLSDFNFENISIDEQKTLAQTLLSSSLTEQLNKLGNRQTGYLGNLHILNYLYRFIHIDAISVNNIIKRKYNKVGSLITSIKNYIPIKLTLSQGQAPSLGQIIVDQQPRGQLTYTMDFIYTNPLYDLMKKIFDQGNEMQKWIDIQRVNYLEPIKNEIDILEQDTVLKLNSNKEAIAHLETVIATALQISQ